MRFAWLTAVAIVAWAVGFGIATVAVPGGHGATSAVAFAICLFPALATLAALHKTEHRGPVAALGAVLIAPLVRLVAITAFGLLAYAVVPAIKADPFRFLCWVTAFYVVTLVTETVLLLPKTRPAVAPLPVPPPNP